MKHDVDKKDKGTKMVLGEKFICGRGCNSVSIEIVNSDVTILVLHYVSVLSKLLYINIGGRKK